MRILPENRRMQFRIGINLGDVIEEGERIYGDGVNIAARLEALAPPGGICVSKTAFDHIESKLPLGYEYLGEQTVKNIARPVGAYRVLLEPRVTVMGVEEKKAPSAKRRLSPAIVLIVILLMGALAVWQFLLKPQLEAQKQATEQAERVAEDARREAHLVAQKQKEEALRREEERQSNGEAERRASEKKKEEEEKQRREREERSRIEKERKQIEGEKQALKRRRAGSRRGCRESRAVAYRAARRHLQRTALQPVPTKAPFCWPVALVVQNGMAEGSWISPAGKGKTATARGTVAADGSVRLNLPELGPER